MKIFSILLFTILICNINLHAQGVGINNTATAPDASAMLDVSSTTKGFLPPRMTLAQRNLISLPATGNIIYQTDDVSGLYVNKGTSSVPNWQLIGPAVPAASPSFFFNTAQSVFDNDYIGLGSNSASFIRNTSVVPVDCVLKSIAFSARGAFSSSTAAVYLQPAGSLTPVATTLSATIIFGGYFSIASGAIPVNAGDLISVRVNGGSIPNGVAVSVTYQ